MLLTKRMKCSFPIIDAHQHFWDLTLGKHPWLCGDQQIPFRYGDYTALKESNYLPKDYHADATDFNIVKTIYMEAEWDPSDPLGETAWVTELHHRTGFPNAIIGQVGFMSEDIAAVISDQAAYPLIRSLRQKPAASPSPATYAPGLPGSLADPKFQRGFSHLSKHNLHFDLQTPWWHLGEAAALARRFPDTTIILNHAGLPSDRSAPGLNGWREALSKFANEPNTAVKISGICQPGKPWTAELNRNVVLETIRIFGVNRCMLASNFPVDKLLASFGEIYSGFMQIISEFSETDQLKLLHDNALAYYRPV